MLHVFNVNRGEMLTFDVNLAMDRVLELKNAISSSHNIHSDKQVMLISGGQALCDDERVCTYAAGTETNPVYLFDKASIEKENAQLCKAYPQNDDFGESIASALALNPSYQTVVSRTKLAILLHEATKRHVATTKSLVHDEHLMHQGWQAAVANLLDTVSGFKERVEVMWTKCSKLLQKSSNYDEALNGIDSVLDILKKIPVFSAILNNSKESVKSSDSAVCRKETMDTNECKDAGMNLLEWIEIKCKNVSVRQILHECKQKISYLSKDKLMTLLGECDKAQHQSMNSRMREISGINERLAALDHLIISGEQQVKEQTGIAQGFVRNQETARDLHNTSSSIDALFTLCESHVTQLRIMRDYEISARDSLRKSLHAKNELAANLHTRLRWLYFIQRGILNADVKLSMFTQQLYQLQQQVEFLSQIKLCPSLYLSSVTEIVRRRCFANSYIQWTNKAVSDARVARDREIVKRKTFQSNITGHFLQKMFHGFSDKPPTFIRKAMRPFDTDLPDVTVDHLSHLSNLLPTFKEILKLPSCKDLSPLSEIFRNKQVLISTAQTTTTSLTLASLSDGSASYPAVTDRGIHPMSTSDKQSGSFTVVDSANVTNDDAQTTLASTRPGGFVVTSLENVTEENLQKNFKSFSRTSPASTTMEGGLPKASFSEPVFSPLPATPATQANSIDATLSEISDIIGPDSPPDSEFFSIQQFHRLADSPNTLRKPLKNIAEADIDGSKPSLSDAEVSATYKVPSVGSSESMSQYSEKQNLSTVFVGSPGSNSSTSYQKVDGISSDEEMFHSVTSDQGKDVKSLKKKLSQLQTEYDTLLNESKQEKEELNTLVRKLQNEITSLEENQGRLESEYDRRWNESKSELDNVIIQLENERIERKKAWNEGSNLEKQLKELTDERDRCKTDMEQFQEQIRQREEMIKHLEASLEEEKNSVTSTLADEQEYHEQRLLQLRTKHEQELQSLKSSSSRFERDLSLVQTELSAADDRIQELETALSDHERLLEENNIQILELQTKMSSLTDEIATSKDSLDKKEQEINVCRQQADETNMKLLKANEQILCLKSILADYETKLNDDRSKENLIKNLKASLRQTELEKNELDCELKSVKQQIIFLQKDVSEKQKELVRMEEMADRDAEIHKEEIEKINLSHSDELQSLLNEKEELLESIKKEYVDAMASVKAELEQQIKTKEEEWLAREKDFELHHRNEVDELEADRLVSVAAAQQSIEELRTKYKETSRLHENEQKELLEKQSQLKKEYQDLKEKSKSVNDKNEKIKKEKNQLEAELQECRNLIRDLEQKCKQNSAIIGQMSLLSSSMLTSSTDEEMESKRTKMDSDSGQGDEMSQSTMEAEAVAENVMTVSMADHKKTIHVLRKNFEHDKKVMQELFKKREEEAARRRQMVFNSAIKRATASKDQELQRLKDVLASKSTIDPLLTQSAFTPPTEPMVTLSNPNSLPSQMSMSVSVASSPPPDLPQTSQKNDSRPVLDNREKDKVTVTNFQVGDTVLVCYNETYQHYTLLTTSRTLHFVHNISLEKLGISSGVGLSAASSARENEAGVANHGTGARQTRDSTVRDCDASPVYLPPTATITSQRLADLRSQMTVNGYNAYIVPSEDEHLSEYIAPREKRRAWITGFSGSAGTAAITQNEAALWTDGRYFLQAEQQLDCNWQLMRIGQPGVPSIEKWINSKLSSNTVGANPFVFSIENWQSYETSFATANNDFNQSIPDLIDDIWQDRPPTLGTEIIILPVEYAGKDWKVKIADVRQRMTEVGADYLLLTVLEEIAWLFNLRGNDIPSVPVFTSYAIVSRDSSIRIYANETQLQPMELQDYLRPQGCLDDHICVDSRKIDEAREDLLGLSDTDTVWMSSASTTYGMYSAVPLERQIQQESPIRIPKSVKNEVEIQGMRQAHIYDAVALCEYLWWLEENVPSLGLNEITGAEKLKTLRLAQEKSKGLSFGSISASGPNGAVIHYGTSEETNRNLTTDEVYLIDSGGQYFEGTTDVTRSVHFGIPTAFEIEAYTRVLMGMIDVELAVFPSSVDGNVLDFVARKYLYDVGLDYRHGTGHGLGHYLSVHEYPPAIGRSYVTGYTLQIGMFTSNEPGYYDEGKFGIRLENVVMVNYTDTKYHFGEYQYYSMTPVTLVPFQKKMIDVSMLTGNQLTYLNAYHSRVLREVGSEAQKQQKYGLYDWLSKVTTPILRSGSHRTVFTSWSVIISFVLALLHARPNMVADM